MCNTSKGDAFSLISQKNNAKRRRSSEWERSWRIKEAHHQKQKGERTRKELNRIT
jgi:hypothetical protein